MVDVTAPLRTAVIGTGFVGPFHVDAARRSGLADVVVMAGSNPDRTATRARSLGVPKATTDVDDVLARLSPAETAAHESQP